MGHECNMLVLGPLHKGRQVKLGRGDYPKYVLPFRIQFKSFPKIRDYSLKSLT